MIIQMKPDAKKEQLQAILNGITALGHAYSLSLLGESTMISVNASVDLEFFGGTEGIKKVYLLSVELPRRQEPLVA